MATKDDTPGSGRVPTLRALLVEDSPQDVKLTAAMLARGGYHVSFDSVDTPTSLQKRLEQAAYDVIISDFNLSGWTALDALKILERSGQKEVPFLVVSGTLGDEAAADVIKRGATDFLLKDRMARLPFAVERAMEAKAARAASRRMEAENLRLATAVEQAAEAVFITDTQGTIQYVNPAFTRITGYSRAEVLGQNPRLLKSGRQDPAFYQSLWTTILAGNTWRGEVINRRKDGALYTEEMTIAPVRDSKGVITNFIAIKTDVTERKRAEQALEQSRQEQLRLKDEFLSHVSHELRTPLTAIYFFTTNLLDGLLGQLTPEQREHLELTLANVRQLKEMIGDLLEVTRAETSKLTIEPRRVLLADLIADVLATCRADAAAKNIRLAADVTPALPLAWADPARVRQVLINLIDNAIKFTPEGGKITVQACSSAEHPGFLCLAVADTGCGISSENCERVFDRLFQAKSNSVASRKGLGLGLFISKELISRQGARMWLESQVGKGSTFYFTLPAFSLAKLCAPVFTERNLQGGSITLIAVKGLRSEAILPAESGIEPQKLLERCILPSQDVLLPEMGDGETQDVFFIVACAHQSGAEIIARRIRETLQDSSLPGHVGPAIYFTPLDVPPATSGQNSEERTSELAARLERLVHAHLHGRKISNEYQENSDHR